MPKKIDIVLINLITLALCFLVIIASAIAYMFINTISEIISKVF